MGAVERFSEHWWPDAGYVSGLKNIVLSHERYTAADAVSAWQTQGS